MRLSQTFPYVVRFSSKTLEDLQALSTATGTPFSEIVELFCRVGCDHLKKINQPVPTLEEEVRQAIRETIPDGDRLSPAMLAMRLKAPEPEILRKRRELTPHAFITWTRERDPSGQGWQFNKLKFGYEKVGNNA
jgi:hypothetical protein